MKSRMKGVSMGVWAAMLVVLVANHSESATSEWPKSMSFPSGRVGTSVYTVVVGMSELISKYTGVKTVPEAGSTSKNIVLLHRKDAELALCFNDSAYFAIRGQDEFKGFGKINVRLLFSNSVPTPAAFITRRDANIRTVADLRGKNVMCIYPPSSTFTLGANILFEAAGMTPANVKAMSFSGNQEGSTALKERRVAAYIHVQTVTSVIPFVQELNTEVPVRLVGVPEDKLNNVLPRYPYFNKGVLTAKIYGEMVDNKDLVSAGVIDNIACRGDLPEDLVHEVMKAIFDHVEELLPIHPVARVWVANPVASAVLPFHAGAVRYYKEKKLWTDELEKKQKQLLLEAGAAK
jgi:TRAP transporter TAXI family solute receptor